MTVRFQFGCIARGILAVFSCWTLAALGRSRHVTFLERVQEGSEVVVPSSFPPSRHR